jgi:hypothetical protein
MYHGAIIAARKAHGSRYSGGTVVRRLMSIAMAAVGLVVVTACSGASSTPATTSATTSSAPNGAAGASASSPAPTRNVRPRRPGTAIAVFRSLKAAKLPVRLTANYTASTDPNGLLGRPSGYRGKVNFADSRVDPSEGDSRDDLMLGGSVEIWPDDAGAMKRARYIAAIGAPIANEYDYVAGPVLLRVSGNLTPTQAHAYARALSKVLGMAAQLVTSSS